MNFCRSTARKLVLYWYIGFFLSGCSISKVNSCRVGSELLKSYTKKTVERILNANDLGAIYWQDEPLNAEALSKATGLNVTIAETQFNLTGGTTKLTQNDKQQTNRNIKATNEILAEKPELLIQDLFVTCSADRDRSYTLTINLELDNPFKVIDLHYEQQQHEANHRKQNLSNQEIGESSRSGSNNNIGVFQIRLPQSTFIVQLNQRISYDECLDVKFVQLSPNVSYDVECLNCTEAQKLYLDRIFSKRMTQLDAELDSILSEKLLLGLQLLLNQQRLDLDLFLV